MDDFVDWLGAFKGLYGIEQRRYLLRWQCTTDTVLELGIAFGFAHGIGWSAPRLATGTSWRAPACGASRGTRSGSARSCRSRTTACAPPRARRNPVRISSRTNRWVDAAATGKLFQTDAGLFHQRRCKPPVKHGGNRVVARSVIHVEKSLWRLECTRVGSEAARGQRRGENPVARALSDMKGLGHCPEVYS